MSEFNALAGRYVAIWNEPCADLRRFSIPLVWAEDCAHFTAGMEVRGLEALEMRVASAHEHFVQAGGFVFRLSCRPDGHHNVLRFKWEMVPADGGSIAAAGSNVCILDEDGRIRLDYQFSEPAPPG